MLKFAAIALALSTGLSVIDMGNVLTLSIQYYVRDHSRCWDSYHCISDPRQYNGIKFIEGDGSEFSRDEENDMEKIYYSGKYSIVSWDKTGGFITYPVVNEYYIKNIINSVNAKASHNCRFKVVVDTGCGIGSLTPSFLLSKLSCRVLTLKLSLMVLSLRNPESLSEVLTELTKLVKITGADIRIDQFFLALLIRFS